jgi:hypothetical protein
LPIGRFGLDLHAGGATWPLSCEPPRPGEDALLRPLGRQTVDCMTVVPAAAAAAFDAGWDGTGDAAPRLRPRHFDRPEGVAALTAASGSAHRPVNVLQIRQDTDRAAEPVSARASAHPVRRTEIDVSGLKLAAILVAFGVPLFLFGRRLQARGVSARVVTLAMLESALLGLALAAVLFAGLRGERGSFAPLVVPAAAFGYACASGIMAVLLLCLFALLDAEERQWHHTIADAVRRTFDVTGSSSRAQFRGYLAFFVAGLYVATRLPHLGGRIATAALAAPLVTLTWRRWWSMPALERTAVFGAVLLFILEVILDDL